MRISIPGFDGLYFDTDAESPAVSIAMTAAGRRAPKPQGYAVQLLPYLWSFDVDLREVPNDHPIQYLHPEGAQSLGELSADRSVRQAGAELESVLRFVWAVNEEVDAAANRLVGRERTHDGVVIEVSEGTVDVDGRELETDEFDVDDAGPATGGDSVTEIGIAEASETDDGDGSETAGFDTGSGPGTDEFDADDAPETGDDSTSGNGSVDDSSDGDR